MASDRDNTPCPHHPCEIKTDGTCAPCGDTPSTGVDNSDTAAALFHELQRCVRKLLSWRSSKVARLAWTTDGAGTEAYFKARAEQHADEEALFRALNVNPPTSAALAKAEESAERLARFNFCEKCCHAKTQLGGDGAVYDGACLCVERAETEAAEQRAEAAEAKLAKATAALEKLADGGHGGVRKIASEALAAIRSEVGT